MGRNSKYKMYHLLPNVSLRSLSFIYHSSKLLKTSDKFQKYKLECNNMDDFQLRWLETNIFLNALILWNKRRFLNGIWWKTMPLLLVRLKFEILFTKNLLSYTEMVMTWTFFLYDFFCEIDHRTLSHFVTMLTDRCALTILFYWPERYLPPFCQLVCLPFLG